MVEKIYHLVVQLSKSMKDFGLKELLKPLLNSMRSFNEYNVKKSLELLFSDSVNIKMCYPFGILNDSESFFHTAYRPLLSALPDLERRDMILIAGTTPEGNKWVGSMGNYMGTFVKPFLKIPPNGHLVHMRYHEFFCIEENKIVEMQIIWDIPELMMQTNSWPMSPQLGAYLCTPSPMTSDGLDDHGDGKESIDHIKNMLSDMCLHPENPDPKIMNLDKYWHPKFNWYGPAGIGACRGVSGFRHWHQIPFLRGMPNRTVDKNSDVNSNWIAETHWIASGPYVCETGWPNMKMNLTNDGWLGIAPVNKEIMLKSLDFWRLESDLIRENWVLVDLLDVFNQVGINVFERLNEFNKARNLGSLPSLEDQ